MAVYPGMFRSPGNGRVENLVEALFAAAVPAGVTMYEHVTIAQRAQFMTRFFALLLPFSLLAADNSIRGFPPGTVAAEQSWESKAQAIPDPQRVRNTVQKLADKPHLAGTPASKAVADYLAGQLREWGLETHVEEFEALLPTPQHRVLEMTEPKTYRARLLEPAVSGDKNSEDADQVPPYNAFSGNGDVTAPLVYVNFGVPADYEYLAKQGISVKGKIVIARYGASWRGVKPKVAAEHGAVGCIIYSDPHEDGYYQGDVYPKGAYRPSGGAQRGSVLDIAQYPGDPLSPGFASVPGAKRLAIAEAHTLMKIPVLPISYEDALPLLENLTGPVAPEPWRGSLPMTYHVGPGGTKVHLKVEMDNSTHPLYDVIARIPGTEFPDQWVLYGNHHDAWVHGADDPLSGAASLLETARSLAQLVKEGWKPKRTVMLAFWDGEEFGLIGSTEWCEKHADELNSKLVAYINSDSNARGHLSAGGSHTLESFVAEVARDVKDPRDGRALSENMRSRTSNRKNGGGVGAPAGNGQNGEGGESGDGKFHLQALGSGSDYTPFLQHMGIASLNLGFSNEGGGGVYHSDYDDYYWYSHFGDPTFEYGRALSEVTTTAVMRLASAPLLPFEFTHFADAVGRYVSEIEKQRSGDHPNLEELKRDVSELKKSAAAFEAAYGQALPKLESAPVDKLRDVNALLFRTERAMTLPQGLPNREWYKHRVYAPGTYTGYAVKTLPGLREAVEGGRLEEAAQQAQQVAEVLRALDSQVQDATRILSGM
jgi:N-acetylated-alpha-linked acidic dipeptidase